MAQSATRYEWQAKQAMPLRRPTRPGWTAFMVGLPRPVPHPAITDRLDGCGYIANMNPEKNLAESVK